MLVYHAAGAGCLARKTGGFERAEGLVVVTRSQRGHIVRVDAGRGSRVWGERTVGGATFKALSSSTSRCSLLFSSVKDPKHLFRYSHSISVCFSFVLKLQFSSLIKLHLILDTEICYWSGRVGSGWFGWEENRTYAYLALIWFDGFKIFGTKPTDWSWDWHLLYPKSLVSFSLRHIPSMI